MKRLPRLPLFLLLAACSAALPVLLAGMLRAQQSGATAGRFAREPPTR